MNRANPPDQAAALPQVQQVIQRLLGDGTVVARSDGTLHRLVPVAVGAAEGEALRGWVMHEGATRTIEIGLGYGISALFICEGLLSRGHVAASHVAVDPTRRRGLATVASRSWRKPAWPGWWSTMRPSRSSPSRDSLARAGVSILPSWTATTASMGSSWIWSTWAPA